MRAVHLLAIILTVASPATLWAQLEPTIDLDPAIDCWYHSDFPMLSATVDPTEDIVRSRLYFRCSLYPDYYFVDLTTDAGTFTGVAPQADESCPRVHYYVEAVTRDFISARTVERVAEVSSANECRRRNPAAAYFTGNDPRIVLGSTVSGPQMAPGFKSLGITAFTSSAGTTVAASTAGGTSTAVIAGGVAAAAGGAVVAVLASGNESSSDPPVAPLTPVNVIPPPAPPAGIATPSGPTPDVKACVRFDPIDAQVVAGQPLTIDGRCSEGGAQLEFIFDLGDGRIKRGQSFLTVVWPNPGDYTMILTVRRSGTALGRGARLLDEDVLTRRVRVAPILEPANADFRVIPDEQHFCAATFDAGPSTGDIEGYDWLLDVENDFGAGTIPANGKTVRYDWGECGISTILVRLTARGLDGSNSTITKEVCIFGTVPMDCEEYYESIGRNGSQQITFVSELQAPGGARAQVILPGGASRSIRAATPEIHSYSGRRGRQLVEGVLLEPLAEPAMWRFDFSQSRIVPGSLRLVVGNEVARGPSSITFRVSGAAGERVRFEYEIAR